jgi:protein-disulfide isomerase
MKTRLVRHSWFVIAIGLAACDQGPDPDMPRAKECPAGCDGDEAPIAGSERKAVAVAGHPSRGADDAPVTIVAFSDFECPYCTKGAANLERLSAEFGDDVRIVFRNMPLPMHPNADRAAIAAAAAHRQGKFWEMHDALFATQGRFAPDDLEALADEAGLDLAQYRRDIADPALSAAVERDIADAKALGIRGTPSFLVNGRLVVGARPFDELAALVREEMAAADPAALVL